MFNVKNAKKVLAMILCVILLLTMMSCAAKPIVKVNEQDAPKSSKKNDGNLGAEEVIDELMPEEFEDMFGEEAIPEDVMDYDTCVDIYTSYLTNGGYEELFGDYYFEVKDEVEVYSYLFDIDLDGILELYLKFVDTSTMGVRGYAQCFFFLDIEDDNVVKKLDAYYGGGSMGGDELYIMIDFETGMTVPGMVSVFRDGAAASCSYTYIYSSDFALDKVIKADYINDPTFYGDEIERIKSETSLYAENQGTFMYFRENDTYISQEEYTVLDERYDVFILSEELYLGSFDHPCE